MPDDDELDELPPDELLKLDELPPDELLKVVEEEGICSSDADELRANSRELNTIEDAIEVLQENKITIPSVLQDRQSELTDVVENLRLSVVSEINTTRDNTTPPADEDVADDEPNEDGP